MKNILNTFFHRMADKMANSGDVHILKTTSRFVGLLTLALSFLLLNNLYLIAGLFAASIVICDFVFMVFRKKESQYKTQSFFETNRILPKNLDRYTTTMNLLRAALLAPMFFYGQLHWYIVFCAFSPLLISCFTGYKPYMPDGKAPGRDPWYQGVPGFGIAGNYTGKPGSIGGQSG
ncbi:MAG TPA: hypothetical protein DD412_07515 [Holosporales bacterium]|nr:hypothetical protein [Holosporales bacterium]